MWHRKWAWLKFPGATAPLVFQRKPLCQKSGYAPDSAARAGDLSALQDAIKRGDDVNSVNEVNWFVGMWS